MSNLPSLSGTGLFVRADPTNGLLVVDSIYHSTLLRALLATMTALAVPRYILAVVVAEVRCAGDVLLRSFLESLIKLGWRMWGVCC